MCTVNINIDEVALREMCPELNSTAAIRQWAQELINSRIREMEMEDTETVDLETARELLLATVREEYSKS